MRNVTKTSLLFSLLVANAHCIYAQNEGSFFEDLAKSKHRVDLSGETLHSSDITVYSTQLSYENKTGPWTLDLNLGRSEYSLDYRSAFSVETPRLEEETNQASIDLSRQWNENWSSGVNARIYDGFGEYRSIWIAEFYRNDFSGASSYRSPDPHGFGYGVNTRWDYAPGSGSLTASANYGKDVIAPGWDFSLVTFQPEATPDTLETLSASLRLDQAINGYLKTSLTANTRAITAREQRYGVENSWSAAYEKYAARAVFGYAQENPNFSARYAGLQLEWNFLPQWYLNAGWRVYNDSGEIETSGFSTAAPGLDTTEYSAGVVWDRGDWAFNLTAAFLDSDYGALDRTNRFLDGLYQDREWYTLRLAASYNF